MKKFQLRDYQADDLKRINKEIKAGHKRVIYSLMTAGGKTVVLHEQVSRWLRKGMRGCVLVHTRALLKQTCDVFSDLPHGIIAGGITPDADKKLQICMVQSLARRGGKAFDFIVVDECHHATASTWAKILADSPDAIILGVTATPFRNDNRGLGQAGFTTIVEGPEVSWLTEQGYLSPVEYYAPTDVDMTGVKKVGGDYEKKESGRRANKRTITGSAVEHYKRHAMGQRALAFCVDIKHVMAVTKQFKKAGLNATFIHGKMSNEEREDILAQFAASKDMILVSCELIGEGLDVPAVACIILLRPTASLVRYIQQVGRGLRVIAGKKHVVVLDHVGNIRLGHPHVPRPIDLDGVQPKAKSLDENSPKSYLRTCPKCKRVETADVLVCSTCGHKFKAVVRGKIGNISGFLCRIDGYSRRDDLRISYLPSSEGYCVCINAITCHLSRKRDIAEKTRDWLVSWWRTNNKIWPDKAKVRDLLAMARFSVEKDYMCKIGTCSGGSSDGFRISVDGKSYHIFSSRKDAEYVRSCFISLYEKNSYKWPSRDVIDFEWRKANYDLAIYPNCNIQKSISQSGSYRYRVPASSSMSPSFKTELMANIARDRFLLAYKQNKYQWPNRSEIELIVRAVKFRHDSSFLRLTNASNGGHSVCLVSTPSYLSADKSIANAARDYLLKFYESNNYEWPPKAEVPALVKKALEHAKSTIE